MHREVLDNIGQLYGMAFDAAVQRAEAEGFTNDNLRSLPPSSLHNAVEHIRRIAMDSVFEAITSSPCIELLASQAPGTEDDSIAIDLYGDTESLSKLRQAAVDGAAIAVSARHLQINTPDPLTTLTRLAPAAAHARVQVVLPEWDLTLVHGDETFNTATETQLFGTFPFFSPSGVTQWLDYLEKGETLSDGLNFVRYVNGPESITARYLPQKRQWLLTTVRGQEPEQHEVVTRKSIEDRLAGIANPSPE